MMPIRNFDLKWFTAIAMAINLQLQPFKIAKKFIAISFLLAEGRIHELGNGWNPTKLGGIHPTIMPMKNFKLRQVIHIAIMATTCYCNP